MSRKPRVQRTPEEKWGTRTFLLGPAEIADEKMFQEFPLLQAGNPGDEDEKQ